ncbi:hypothetical protein BDFB_013870, partial [Asbolus verrucosus]
KIEFHTYTPADEKTHAFVIRRLDQKSTLEEIVEDLKNNYRLEANKVYEMKGTARPLYLCHRCQEWRHATSNCPAKPKCLKCARSHLTREYAHQHLNNPKRANCNGEHVANSTMCPIYIKKVEFQNQIKQTEVTKKKTYQHYYQKQMYGKTDDSGNQQYKNRQR